MKRRLRGERSSADRSTSGACSQDHSNPRQKKIRNISKPGWCSSLQPFPSPHPGHVKALQSDSSRSVFLFFISYTTSSDFHLWPDRVGNEVIQRQFDLRFRFWADERVRRSCSEGQPCRPQRRWWCSRCSRRNSKTIRRCRTLSEQITVDAVSRLYTSPRPGIRSRTNPNNLLK